MLKPPIVSYGQININSTKSPSTLFGYTIPHVRELLYPLRERAEGASGGRAPDEAWGVGWEAAGKSRQCI